MTEVSLVPGRVTETNLEPAPGRERDTLCSLERVTDLRPEERDTDCSLLCIEWPEWPEPARVTEGNFEDCSFEFLTKERFTVW